jgi:ligand-binding sensor domain-containing protein
MGSRHWWKSITQFLLGVGIVLGLGLLIKIVSPSQVKMPPGWRVIRPPNEVSALAIQGDVVWAGGKDGLAAIDRRSSQLQKLPEGAPRMRYVKDLLVDRKGNLWIGHHTGLAKCKNGKWETYPQVEQLINGPILSILEGRDGVLWVGGEKGVVYLDGETFRPFTIPEELKLPSVDVIFQDRSGAMWFGSASPTRGGLLCYYDRQWRGYTINGGLAHHSVNAVIQDRHGALWFGLGFGSRGAASRLKNKAWTSITKENGLAGEKVRSIYEDQDGRMWFGSEYDGIAINSDHHWVVLTPKHGLAGWEVKEMIQDVDGVYWLGTEDGLSRIESIDWESLGKG